MNGNSLLTDNGEEICINDATQIKPRTKASSQGAYVIWEDYRNLDNDIDIYSQKVDHMGTVYWDINGVAIVSDAGEQNNERLTVDGNGGIYYVWMDRRSNESYDI